MELEIENTEVVSADNIQIEAPGSVEVIEGEKDYEVSVVKKEYTIIGDSIFIPSMYEDAPPWLKEFIDTTINVAVTNRDQSLIDRLHAILSLLDYVPKNQYTEQINQIINEDGIINSRIATLNSYLEGAIHSTNATIAEINLTYASKDEAAAIAINALTASLSGNGEIGSALIQLQEAYANLESTTAQSISMLESVMEGEINGNATAMETIRTYVGIDETGASTGVGTLDIILNNIQNQVDGSISTWFYNSEPTLYNLPASEWTTTETRNIHLGDIYYDRSTGFAYRFAFEDIEDIPDAGTIYTWIRITDSDITKALADAAQAQETADGKITTYYQSSTPIAEGIGDIWIDSDDGNKMYRWNGSTWGSDLVGTMVANSQAITTLQTNLNSTNTTVGGHTTQLSTVDTRISNGMASVETKWAYNSTVNINGVYKKSGFGLTTNYTSGNGTQANPYVSEFWIDASRLKFTNSNQTGQVAPFTIDASGATPQITFNGKVTFSNVNGANMSGSNLLYNSAPAIGFETKGWQADYNDTGIASSGVVAAGDPYRPTGGGSFHQYIPGTPAVGKVFDIRAIGAIPVIGGQFYEGSAYLNSHRCDSRIYVGWRDSAGAIITWSMGDTVIQTNTSNVLSTWGRSKFIVQAPANAVSCYYYIRGTSTGEANPYVFASMCYFGRASEGQSVFSSWSEGISGGATTTSELTNTAGFTTLGAVASQGYVLPTGVANAINTNTTTINGSKITTGSITAAQIAAGTITADKISTYNLTAANSTFQNSIITNAAIANGAITNAKIGDAQITTAKIGDAQITNAKIANLSVDTLKIQDEAVIVPRYASGNGTAGIYYTPAVNHTVYFIITVPKAYGNIYVKVYANGSTVYSYNGIEDANHSGSFPLSVSAGTSYTFAMTAVSQGENRDTQLYSQLLMLGIKK